METILFGDPFYNHIIHYLNPTTLYNLCKSCKSYRNNINKQYFEIATVKEIRKRLRHTEDEKEMLCELKGIISGSFIVDCVLKERFSYSSDEHDDLIWQEYTSIDHFFPKETDINIIGRQYMKKMPLNKFFMSYCSYYLEMYPGIFRSIWKFIILFGDSTGYFIDNCIDFDFQV